MPEKTINSLLKLTLELQNPYHYRFLPSHDKIQSWAEAACQRPLDVSITVRFIDLEEGLTLNQTYRQKAYATNILSFSFDLPVLPEGVVLDTPHHLGDLVICLPIIEKEAQAQQKSFEQHCAHLIVHGMLHLQGYDHIEEQLAQQMEILETNILEKFGYPNPYLTQF